MAHRHQAGAGHWRWPCGTERRSSACPANPVAAFVCALIFARPALAALSGAGWSEPLAFTVPAAFSKNKKPGRREYLRARLDAKGQRGSVRLGGIRADQRIVMGDGTGGDRRRRTEDRTGRPGALHALCGIRDLKRDARTDPASGSEIDEIGARIAQTHALRRVGLIGRRLETAIKQERRANGGQNRNDGCGYERFSSPWSPCVLSGSRSNRSQPWHDRLLQPRKQALREARIDAAEHSVRRHRRDRLAEIGGAAQFHGKRHTTEEGHAETPGFLLCPAFTENRVMRTANPCR